MRERAYVCERVTYAELELWGGKSCPSGPRLFRQKTRIRNGQQSSVSA